MEKGFQQDHDGGYQDHGSEVFFFVFIPHYTPSVVKQPGKEALCFPPSFVTPQSSAVLGRWSAAATSMRCNQLHTQACQLFIQGIGVKGPVTNEPLGQLTYKALGQGGFH
jgi:hypothetical protein